MCESQNENITASREISGTWIIIGFVVSLTLIVILARVFG